MTIATLRDLYHAELNDLYEAEQLIVAALPTFQSAAASPELKAAFEHHLERSRLHIERLDLVFQRLGITPGPSNATAAEALVRDARRRVDAAAKSGALDAALIAAAQHVEHYEIAGYGCARTFARLAGDEAGARLLQETLDEEGAADKELTRIAMSGINQDARAGQEADTAAYSRLRYVDADDLDPGRHSWTDHSIFSRSGDELGTVDGVLVGAAGRPYYLVIDSGGVFVGKRYIVPVGRVELDRNRNRLSVDLDKPALKRYPEFHSGAFASMTDDETRRYEWRVLEAIDPAAARRTPGMFSYDDYTYYRQPDWLGSDWSAARRASRTTTGEPFAVGTTGDAPSSDTGVNDRGGRNRRRT